MSKIYYNGIIISMEDNNDIEAILVEDGIITKVGTLEEVKNIAPEDTKFVDLQGNTLMPAFIDSHAHTHRFYYI